MHNQNGTEYSEDIILSMRKFFERTYEISDRYGISRDNIILDPGIGFGKGMEENIEVLARLEELRDMGRILLGTSKKRFIGTILGGLPTDEISSVVLKKYYKYGKIFRLRYLFNDIGGK